MKKILTALAGVALVTAPLALTPVAAQAQHRGGGFHGGYGGFRGGYGYRGGWGGYRGYGYGYGWGAAGLGFALGAALSDPWYYGPDYYGYYGAYGPPAPVVYAAPPPAYGYAPPPQAAPAQPSACGQWSWDQAASRYNWIPGPCGAGAPPAQTY
jgi:hypothetical protein